MTLSNNIRSSGDIKPSYPSGETVPLTQNPKTAPTSETEAVPTETKEQELEKEGAGLKSNEQIPAEKTPEARKHDEALKLATWMKKSSALLQQIDSNKNIHLQTLNKKTESTATDPSDVAMESIESPGQFREEDVVEMGIGDMFFLGDQAVATVVTAAQLGGAVNFEILNGFTQAATVGKELTSGLSFLGAKWELHNLKLERDEIAGKLTNLPENHPAFQEVTRRVEALDSQIKNLEASKLSKFQTFLMTTIESCISGIFTILSRAPHSEALLTASAGGSVFGAIGMAGGAVGVVSNAAGYLDINEKLVEIVQAEETHDNPKVAAAMSEVKSAAIDHAAFHQKRNAVIGIFQSAFIFCQSAFSTIAGLLGSIALGTIGTAVGTSAVAAAGLLGPAVPVLTGIGILITGAIYAYQNRNTIRRGAEGFISKREGDKLDRFDPARNLTIRKLKKQAELKEISAKLLKLGSIHAQLLPENQVISVDEMKDRIAYGLNMKSLYLVANNVSRAVNNFFSTGAGLIKEAALNLILPEELKKISQIDEGDFDAVDKAIDELSVKFFAVKEELEKIDYKIASQQLKDETGTIANATVARKEVMVNAILELQAKTEKIDKVISQLSGKDKWVSPENAFRAQKNAQLKIMNDNERKILKLLKSLRSPNAATVMANIKPIYEGKVASLKDQLKNLTPDKQGEIDRIKDEIIVLEKCINGDVEAGIQYENSRLSKVRDDIKVIIDPKKSDIKQLIEVYQNRREELQDNISILEEKLEQIEVEANLDENEIELNSLEGGKSPRDFTTYSTTQTNLSKKIESLGEGEDLVEFMEVYKKLGVTFDDFDRKKNKNEYVQTQIQNALTSQSIQFNI